MKRLFVAAAALIALTHASIATVPGKGSPGDLLPAEKDLEGWRKDGETLVYEPDNLWEYINGQAEAFLMYDFREVAAQHYLSAADLEIKAEIYEHGSVLMAFGIYSQFRSTDGAYLEIGNEAFGDEYSLHFWKGSFYVKISAYEEGEESDKAMKEFARVIAERIPQGGRVPAETALFPQNGLVEKSVTYVSEGVLGSGKLPPAFSGEYKTGDEKGKMYIFSLESDDASEKVFAWYAGEIGARSADSDAGGKSYVSASGEAPYRGHVRIFRHGRFVGILTGFGEDSKRARSIVDETVVLMAERCGQTGK